MKNKEKTREKVALSLIAMGIVGILAKNLGMEIIYE